MYVEIVCACVAIAVAGGGCLSFNDNLFVSTFGVCTHKIRKRCKQHHHHVFSIFFLLVRIIHLSPDQTIFSTVFDVIYLHFVRTVQCAFGFGCHSNLRRSKSREKKTEKWNEHNNNNSNKISMKKNLRIIISFSVCLLNKYSDLPFFSRLIPTLSLLLVLYQKRISLPRVQLLICISISHTQTHATRSAQF